MSGENRRWISPLRLRAELLRESARLAPGLILTDRRSTPRGVERGRGRGCPSPFPDFGPWTLAFGLLCISTPSATRTAPWSPTTAAASTSSHISVDSDQLVRLKAHLGTLGADVDAIDSVAHSIDYGDPFTVTVEVEDPKQILLPIL